MVRNYNTLYHLGAVLDRVDTAQAGRRGAAHAISGTCGSGENELAPEQLFSVEEQELFTRALSLGREERKDHPSGGRCRHRKVGRHPARRPELAVRRGRAGPVPHAARDEEARIAGLAWERLPDPKPRLTLEIYFPSGQEHVFYLGPHCPGLTPKEIDLLHGIWLELSSDVAPEEIHHHDVIHFALQELQQNLSNAEREAVLQRLRAHLEEIKDRRASTS